MNKFLIFKPGWWLVHALAAAFMFWLGHAITF
jgi:hypothetical protein